MDNATELKILCDNVMKSGEKLFHSGGKDRIESWVLFQQDMIKLYQLSGKVYEDERSQAETLTAEWAEEIEDMLDELHTLVNGKEDMFLDAENKSRKHKEEIIELLKGITEARKNEVSEEANYKEKYFELQKEYDDLEKEFGEINAHLEDFEKENKCLREQLECKAMVKRKENGGDDE